MSDHATVISDGKGHWIHYEEYQAMQKWQEKQQDSWFRYMRYGIPRITEARAMRSLTDRTVYAYIIVGNTRKLCWYNPTTEKAYKADRYERTWMEWKHFKFERFCTSFDL